MVGMLTEQDLLRSLSEKDPQQIAVNQAMQTSVVCYPEETPLADIYDFLTKVAIPKL